MAGVGTYSGGKVVVTFGGVILTGLDEDEGISIEQVGDGITSKNGLDGSVARAVPVDFRFKGTIKLQDVSPSNDVLSGFYLADIASGTGALPMTVSDLSGRTEFVAVSAWVVKMPAVAFGKENKTRDWPIEGVASVAWVGGNS